MYNNIYINLVSTFFTLVVYGIFSSFVIVTLWVLFRTDVCLTACSRSAVIFRFSAPFVHHVAAVVGRFLSTWCVIIEILFSDHVSVSVIADVDYRSRSSTGRRRTSAKNSRYIVRTSSSVRSDCGTWPSSTWPTASSASSRARTWWASTSRRSWNSGDGEATASTAELYVCCRRSASNASLPRRRLLYHWRPSTEPCDVIRWRHRRPLTAAAAGLSRDWFI